MNAERADEPADAGLMKSLDGVTSPVVFSREDDGSYEVRMRMSEKGFSLLWGLAEDADAGLEDVIGRALILYRSALQAEREGKAVGVATDPGVLDVRFVDLSGREGRREVHH